MSHKSSDCIRSTWSNALKSKSRGVPHVATTGLSSPVDPAGASGVGQIGDCDERLADRDFGLLKFAFERAETLFHRLGFGDNFVAQSGVLAGGLHLLRELILARLQLVEFTLPFFARVVARDDFVDHRVRGVAGGRVGADEFEVVADESGV